MVNVAFKQLNHDGTPAEIILSHFYNPVLIKPEFISSQNLFH